VALTPGPPPLFKGEGKPQAASRNDLHAGEGIQYPNAMDRLRTLAMRPYLPIAIIFLFLLMALLVWQLAAGTPASNGNPGVEPTTKARMTTEANGHTESNARLKAWTTAYLVQPHDYRALPRIETLKSYIGPLPDLATATQDASLIVSGVVSQTQFHWDDQMDGSMAVVTVQVSRVLKGEVVGGVIKVTQTGGPAINFQTGEVSLGEDEIDPILLAGDRVVLFLQPTEVQRWEPWMSQGWSGQYTVDANDRVHTIEGNAFANDINGLPLDTFLGKVAALAGAR
jgi:hypothetical protein